MAFVQITQHARERYLERNFPEFSHLENCKNKQCMECTVLNYKIKYRADSEKKKLNDEIRSNIIPSNKNNSLLNNSSFMDDFFKNHGFDSTPEFYLNDRMIFVVSEISSLKSVVTCLKGGSFFGNQPLQNHKKFKVKSKPNMISETTGKSFSVHVDSGMLKPHNLGLN